MPKLLVFAPCERVIIDATDNSGSMIAILQGYTLHEELKLGAQLVLPFPWYVYALWEGGEPGKPYKQKFELESPTGEVLIKGEAEFTFVAEKRFHRVHGKLAMFPVKGIGEYKLNLYLKSDGEYERVATFPIPISPSVSASASSAEKA